MLAIHLCLGSKTLSWCEVAAQAARMDTPEKKKADALKSVSGFAFHIQDAIRNTHAEAVSRSRIVDRCTVVVAMINPIMLLARPKCKCAMSLPAVFSHCQSFFPAEEQIETALLPMFVG